MHPLMEAYKTIRCYGTITRDVEYTTAWGHCRRLVIEYDNKLYSVAMLNGEVLKIEAIG